MVTDLVYHTCSAGCIRIFTPDSQQAAARLHYLHTKKSSTLNMLFLLHRFSKVCPCSCQISSHSYLHVFSCFFPTCFPRTLHTSESLYKPSKDSLSLSPSLSSVQFKVCFIDMTIVTMYCQSISNFNSH